MIVLMLVISLFLSVSVAQLPICLCVTQHFLSGTPPPSRVPSLRGRHGNTDAEVIPLPSWSFVRQQGGATDSRQPQCFSVAQSISICPFITAFHPTQMAPPIKPHLHF